MNQVDPPEFAELLMKSEPGDDELRRRYEEGKLALLERRLTPWQRRMAWLTLPVYGLLIIGSGYLLLMAKPTLPRELVVLDAVSAVGVLALGLWMLRVLLRGGRVTWQHDQAMSGSAVSASAPCRSPCASSPDRWRTPTLRND